MRRKKGEPNPLIICACGCGETLYKYDKYGRSRLFLKEHRHFIPLSFQFEKFVIKKDGCWGWTGTKSTNGYPQIRHNKKIIHGNRVSYELHHGEIPRGLDVLHKCDNPECTNPDHLFLGSHLDNMHDAILKGRMRGKRTFSDDFIKTIRDEYAKGERTVKELGKIYGIGADYLSRIVNHKARRYEYACTC
ncbi:MAG: HNH endonuclease [Deltaproteobacteria bacterium]|nr:HNH endonuclease [Deltaproteobacteria bacterium]